MSDTLFPILDEPSEPEIPAESGPFAGVALEQSIDRTLDYAIGPRLRSAIQVGQRVRVPLGRNNRPAHGYVVSIHPTSQYPAKKIKRIIDIDDDRVLVTPELMELARWMSRYYLTPLGIVLDNVIPSAVKKRIGLGYSKVVRLARDRQQVQDLLEKTRPPKRRAILGRLLQLEPGASIEIARLAGEAGVTIPTVRKLAASGVITIRPEVDLPRLTDDMSQGAANEPDIVLNKEQQKAFGQIEARIAERKFSVSLIHGVTGSGKTEIYMQCIRQVIAQGKQALVLVPEIALTPQTVRRFMARFSRVAILHSGLMASQRHKYWQQISQGHADVVVGARSAVFAPVKDLGLIVVDEEHESSYKQDQNPRYNARDVAIKRAQLAGVPVILGSATPSLESYHRATAHGPSSSSPGTPGEDRGGGLLSTRGDPHPNPLSGYQGRGTSPYALLTLPSRVRGLSLPAVELVDMRTELRHRPGIHLISTRLEYLLRRTLEAKHQAIILLNRRGYASFVCCKSCGNVVQCKYCDATMTYHRSADARAHSGKTSEGVHTGQLHCHYCLAVNTLPATCPACGKQLSLFGLGTQRVEEELLRRIPDCKFARVDSDSMRSGRDYERLLERFSRGEVQVLLGTQMIAKGLDYPNVTLVGVISGDTALSLPDFRAAERTFQLITQVAGRAGRGDAAGRVVLQTFLPDDPTILAAMKQDYLSFAASELESRRQVGLPPFARMVRLVMRDQDGEKLNLKSQELATKLAAAIEQGRWPVRLRGPTPCAIGRIAGHFRNQIVLTAERADPLQQLLAAVRTSAGLTQGDWVAVDVDPISLL